MQAQLDGGIAEEERKTTKSEKRTEGGLKGVLGHYQGTGEEQFVHKSLGDALFPTLEESLEAEGLLFDISDALQAAPYWSDRLRVDHSPGTLVRITSLGSLFDARYVAKALAGFAATYSALDGFGALSAPLKPSRPPAKGQSRPKPQSPSPVPDLEDLIPEFGPMVGADGTKLDAEFFRRIVRLSRGMFTPGLHLNLTPTPDDALCVGARLQEGRQFLDGDAEMLFARYGVGKQEWTLVGAIGYFAQPQDRVAPSPDSITNDEGNVIRGIAANYINSLMKFLGALGFADRLPYPGFSVVPLAVYRSIPRISSTELVTT